MTYIEFFDKTPSENIAACLVYAPDRVVLIGDNSNLMNEHKSNYEKVFSARGENIEFICRSVPGNSLEKAIAFLSEIIEKYDDCVFDITGGNEILTLALGMVYSKYPDKNIQIHKLNIGNNAVYDCDSDGITLLNKAPELSIEENIRLCGGEVSYGDIDDNKTYKWDLSLDFLKDIELMWDTCKQDVHSWNKQIDVFKAIVAIGKISEDELTAETSVESVKSFLLKSNMKYKLTKRIISDLVNFGLITDFEEDESTIRISFKNKQVKKCLTKAGQALEMKIFVAVKNALGKDGVPVYNDVLNGVVIDWDGKFHDETKEDTVDTENEIDVMMMHNMVPVFISCKNGSFTAEELYKLNTVAGRFGGKYSKKVLVATAIDHRKPSNKYLLQRIKDMDIYLIENIQYYTDEKLVKELSNLWH